MGLLDKALKLPTAVGSVADQAVNYATASVNTLVSESFGKVTSTFGATGQFSKIFSSAPSFSSIASAAVLGNSLVRQGVQLGGIGGSLRTSAALAAQAVGLSASAIKDSIGDTSKNENTYHKVKLRADVGDGESLIIDNKVGFPADPLTERVVEFDAMPEVTENRTVDYEPLSPPQLPGEFQKYRGTKSTQWTISATLTSRTRDEADRNYRYLSTLRGWTMPYFGEKQRSQFAGTGKLGAPPPVIKFSGWRGLVGEVPVVLTQLSWVWPKECDWIPTRQLDEKNQQPIPFPTVINIQITLVESFSAAQFNGFDLVQFREGRMIDAYKPDLRQPRPAIVSEPIGGNQGVTNATPQPLPQASYSNEGRNYLQKKVVESAAKIVPAPRRGGTVRELRTNAYVARGDS